MNRTRVSKLLFVTIVSAASLVPAQPALEPRPLAFTHVTVIDATGARAQPDMTVVIAGERITEIGPSRSTQPPKDMPVIDASGRFLIPGLWDMHVHWYDATSLNLFTANGVTGVRVMWGLPTHIEWRQATAAGTLVGPRVVVGSPVLDGPHPIWPGSLTASNAAEGRQAVATLKSDGWDFVKVGSFLPRDAFLAIADEARKKQIAFGGHVPEPVSAAEASDSGQKSVEHLTGVLLACSTREAEFRAARVEVLARPDANVAIFPTGLAQLPLLLDSFSPEKAAGLFARFARNRTWHCPTLTVLRSSAFFDDPSFTNDPRNQYVLRSLVAGWDPKKDFRFTMRTPRDWAAVKRSYRNALELVGSMRRAGVRFVAGTDTPNPYCYPGFSLHDELGLLVEAGLTPMEALQAATRNPAEFLGTLDSSGTVAKGKIADLVLLDANPLDDIRNTRRIHAVVQGGRLYTRTDLDGMLAANEKRASLKSIGRELAETMAAKDLVTAIARYRELKAHHAGEYEFGWEELNTLGYELLEAKRTADAVRILELNVEAYPQSADAYDSLGEACLAHGDRPCAIANYKKSLELNPKNPNAVEVLKKLAER